MSNELDTRKLDELYRAFENADNIIMKKYLNSLDEMPIRKVSDDIKNIKEGSNFQIFKIQSIVYDKNENNIDKLTTVYNSLSSYKEAAIVVFVVGKASGVDIYMGSACRKYEKTETKDESETESKSKSKVDINLRAKQKSTLETAFLSNFIGSGVNDDIKIECKKNEPRDENNNEFILGEIFDGKNAVTALNGVPAIRNEQGANNERFIQGIEKFIDSMKGQKYSVIFLADVVNAEKIEYICAQYEDLYSQLYPFAKSEQTLNTSEQRSEIDSIIKGITDTTNESISKATGIGTTESTFSSNSVGGSVGVSVGKGGSASIGVSADYHHTKGKSTANTQTTTDTKSSGTAKSLTEQNSVSHSLTTGTGEAIQISYMNRAVKTLLDRIDEHIKRLRSFEDVGVFDCGAYFLSESSAHSIAAATKYRALIRGENSSIEGSALNTWENEGSIKYADEIFEYLKKLYHPSFLISGEGDESDKRIFATPTTMMSGKELALEISLPKKSVSGLPVIECAEFGRDVVSYDNKENAKNISLGKIFHMHRDEENSPVELDRNSFSSHVFITGSTGAGKSNTVFKILNEATRGGDVKLLVVEPAKGEYKDVFGGRDDVSVYGTNPKITELLKINPFSFPENILVSEHIDRLVEIFNVCWPMYAAMPAILKSAVIRAYESCGWDMNTSENVHKIFPNFLDVLREIRYVLDESEYSADNKSDYTGALVERLKSLTNGINGQIFGGAEIPEQDLFDKNVIVDLSRVGSTETKSLIMGLLMVKLQEYRMSEGKPDNSDLKHITVLEEAHNLLKRTSTEQASETANLLGKAVELIANSIAELRSFGEGFIIADQSPGLLDMSVIRNTNTKIIHRLPDFSDRELVGKAASLNDEQIIELAKLPLGVAAVYQNDWINPVLCHIEKYTDKKEYKKPVGCNQVSAAKVSKDIIDIVIRPNEHIELSDKELNEAAISGGTRFLFDEYINKKDKTVERTAKLVLSVLSDCGYRVSSQNTKSAESIERTLTKIIKQIAPDYKDTELQKIIALVLKGQAERNADMVKAYVRYVEAL